jgi:PadR family transcriptional regulator PadR
MNQQESEKILENTTVQMRKGVLEFAIILIISKGKTYANDILRKLKEGNMVVVEGTIYPLLSRLKNSGLIGYEWEESKSGPPRKYYTITDSGKSFLKGCDTEWKKLEKAINLLKQ